MAIHGFGSTAMGDPLDHFWSRSNIFTASSLWVASTKLNEMAFLALASKVEGEKKKQHMSTPFGVFSSGKKRGLTGLLLCGFFPQIALAIGVLTSWGVRVRRICGFVARGAVTQGVVGGVVWCVLGSGFADPRPGCRHTGCRWRCNLRMCVGVRGLQI